MDVQGRQVTVIGLARSGLAAARWLLDHGAEVTVTEAQETAATRRTAQQLRLYAAVSGRLTIELGAHTRGAIAGRDLVVVSPGVPETAPALRWAEAARAPVVSEVELAARACAGPIVAVTGTNGKTTVTTLIGRILRAAGRSVEVCGNIGRPFCDVVDRVRPETVAVLEVSSFQLLHCPTLRPRVAVLLNLSANHLDHHPTFAAYAEAKSRLFANQTPEDWAVLNAADAHVQRLAQRMRGRLMWFNAPSPESGGDRNPNYEAAACVVRILDVPDTVIQETLRNFRGLEHRLEPVATVQGVAFINDSKSTTPASLLWALERQQTPLVLIMGGRNKGCDFASVREALQRSTVKQLVLMGESRAALRRTLQEVVPTSEALSLTEAVRQAFDAARAARPAASVLFSPGCASFDLFADYEDRGRQFKAEVRRLAEEAASADPAASVPGAAG